MIPQMQSSIKHIRRLSTPSTMTIPTIDSGLNTSTICTTSRSRTPDLNEDTPSVTFEIDSIFNRTLTKDENSSKQSNKTYQTIHIKKPQSERIKRVLKRYLEQMFFFVVNLNLHVCLDYNGVQ